MDQLINQRAKEKGISIEDWLAKFSKEKKIAKNRAKLAKKLGYHQMSDGKRIPTITK